MAGADVHAAHFLKANANDFQRHADPRWGLEQERTMQRKRTAREADLLPPADSQPKRSRLQAFFGGLSALCGFSQPAPPAICRTQHVETWEPRNSTLRELTSSGSEPWLHGPPVAQLEAAEQQQPAALQPELKPKGVPTSALRSQGHVNASQHNKPHAARHVRFEHIPPERFSDLVHIQPEREFERRIDLSEASCAVLTLRNVSKGFVAFKFRASSTSCLARPSQCTLHPGTAQEVRVSLTSSLKGKRVQEQYLVQATVARSDAPISREEWAALDKSAVYELKLPVVRQISTTAMTLDQMLRLEPARELRFSKSQFGAEASLTIENVSDVAVAFKLQAKVPSAFMIHPEVGRLAPHAKVNIRVHEWAQPTESNTDFTFCLKAVPWQSDLMKTENWARLPQEVVRKKLLNGRIAE